MDNIAKKKRHAYWKKAEVIICIGLAVCTAPSYGVETESEFRELLHPVRLQKIKVDGFWREQFKRQIEDWFPHCIEQMEKGGRGEELLNLVNAAKALNGKPASEFKGLRFSDAYVYNIMEAICYALQIDPSGDRQLAAAQNFLENKMDEWIPIILAAQCDDGYIHSFTILKGFDRYTDIGRHEFYTQGYFIEAGVAHYRLTDGEDRRLYDAAVKCADHLYKTFGPGTKRVWSYGHPGMGIALCRLARLVNEVESKGEGDKYYRLAKHLFQNRHKEHPSEYRQSHMPVVKMENAVGHAVRGTYFYAGIADLAMLTEDRDYLQAANRIWEDAIQRKHYITGGVGARHNGESFGEDYQLPNNGYCESCATSGITFWADRMFWIHKRGHYHAVIERALYNTLSGSVDLKGKTFFYQNPPHSDTQRHAWHHCPCCVGNIPRSLLHLKDYLYALDSEKETLYINQYADCEATVPEVAGQALRIKQSTRYPWDGEIAIALEPEEPVEFDLKLRIPDRTESGLYKAVPDLKGRFTVELNGQKQDVDLKDGYATLRRRWKDGDSIVLRLPMDVQRVYCDDRVEANRGRVAVQRGPIVYSFEDVDHERSPKKLELDPDSALKAVWRGDLLGGVMAIESENPKMRGVPFYTRLNRGGWSRVWIREKSK